MWSIREQTSCSIEVVLAMHNAKFNKHNVLIDINANCVTCGMVRHRQSTPHFANTHLMRDALMQKGVPGANGSRNTIILQGQWESAIVKDETVWQLEADGKLVLDIRKRVEGHWKVLSVNPSFRCPDFYLCLQILIRSGINGDDSLIDPLSRVILGIAAAQSQNHDYALQCYERSAQEGSWHAMRKLAALFALPFPMSPACLIFDGNLSSSAQLIRCSFCSVLACIVLIRMNAGTHLTARKCSPTLSKMSKRVFHTFKWAPSKPGIGCIQFLRSQPHLSCFSHNVGSDAQFILAHAYLRYFHHPLSILRIQASCSRYSQWFWCGSRQQSVCTFFAASGHVRAALVRRSFHLLRFSSCLCLFHFLLIHVH